MASTMDQRKSNSKPILESQLDLLREGTFSDVTFIVGKSKERMPCHQLFLKARSSVFEVMFNERWNQDKEVILEDVDPKIFQKFLEFIYSDSFAANVSEALALLQVAHMYDVQLLVSKCEQLLKSQVTLDNALDVFQVARKYDKPELMDKVGDLWATSMSKLQGLPYFSRVDKETLKYILKRNDLNMKEVDVFRLVAQWTKNQTGLLESAEDILALIRFPTMTLADFTATVVPTGLLSPSSLIELFTYFGTDAGSKKSLASSLKFSTQPRVVKKPLADAIQTVDVIKIVDKPPTKAIRGPPLVSVVELYFGDFDHCRIERQEYVHLKECLEFDVRDKDGCSYKEFETDSEPEKSNIAMNSISLYCPRTSTRSGCYLRTKEFRIIVKTKRHYRENYKIVLPVSAFDVEEGKITEVELRPVVPIEIGMKYCVIVEEVESGAWGRQVDSPTITYEARDFGRITKEGRISMGEKSLRFTNFQRNNLSEFQDYYENGDPHLICKLGVKETPDLLNTFLHPF